jgi:hypothetical protein
MGKIIFYIIGLVSVLTFGYAQAGSAVSTLTVTPSGDGVFVVQGHAMDNIAAMDITIKYDTASLADPRIHQGDLVSGALIAVNTNIQGTVRLGIISTKPINGSGVIATLDFTRISASAGKIKKLSVRLSAINGNLLPVMVYISDPPDPETNIPGQPDTESDSPDTSSSSDVNGSIYMPWMVGGGQGVQYGNNSSDLRKEDEENEQAWITGQYTDPVNEPMSIKQKTGTEAPGRKEPETGTLELTITGGPVKGYQQEGKIHIQIILASVLDRFQEYKGERTAKEYLSFFEKDITAGFLQEPSIIIADGKSTVKMIVNISEFDNIDVSTVWVAEGRLISMKKDPDNAYLWLVDLQPEKDAYMTSLIVPLEKFDMILPLTAAPRQNIDIDRSGTITEDDFSLFLKKQSKQGEAVFDLNGDGKQDSLDDYIYAVNYLAAQRAEKVAPLK